MPIFRVFILMYLLFFINHTAKSSEQPFEEVYINGLKVLATYYDGKLNSNFDKDFNANYLFFLENNKFVILKNKYSPEIFLRMLNQRQKYYSSFITLASAQKNNNLISGFKSWKRSSDKYKFNYNGKFSKNLLQLELQQTFIENGTKSDKITNYDFKLIESHSDNFPKYRNTNKLSKDIVSYQDELNEITLGLGLKRASISQFKRIYYYKKDELDATKNNNDKEQCILKALEPEKQFKNITLEALKKIYSEVEAPLMIEALNSNIAFDIYSLTISDIKQKNKSKELLNSYIDKNKDDYIAYTKYIKHDYLMSSLKNELTISSEAYRLKYLEECERQH